MGRVDGHQLQLSAVLHQWRCLAASILRPVFFKYKVELPLPSIGQALRLNFLLIISIKLNYGHVCLLNNEIELSSTVARMASQDFLGNVPDHHYARDLSLYTSDHVEEANRASREMTMISTRMPRLGLDTTLGPMGAYSASKSCLPRVPSFPRGG